MSDHWQLDRTELDRDLTRSDDAPEVEAEEVAPAKPTRAEVEALEKQYSDQRVAYELAMADYERARAVILAPVQKDLDDLGAEVLPVMAVADEKIKATEAELREAVKGLGETYKGWRYEVRYAAGRRTVKVGDLERVMKKIKDPTIKAMLEALINEGEPSTSIYPLKSVKG